MVPESEWVLGSSIATRHSRLLDVPAADVLLTDLIAEAESAASTGSIRLDWQLSSESPGFFRVVTRIALTERVFDQFFNGRSGYRAQYYLSPEEGVLYNHDVMQRLKHAIATAYSHYSLGVDLDLVFRSMDGPHSKVWVYDDQEAFNSAPGNSLNPPRWVQNNAFLGRRAPLPKHLSMDVKGAFVHTSLPHLFVDELKVDRACDIFRKGYT